MTIKVCKTQGKHCYPSQMAAIRAAISYSKSRGVALRVYRHSCGSWHLTRRPNIDTNTDRRSA